MSKCTDCDWKNHVVGNTTLGVKIWCDAFGEEKLLESIINCEKYSHNERVDKESFTHYRERIYNKKLSKNASKKATLAIIISILSLIAVIIKLVYDLFIQ